MESNFALICKSSVGISNVECQMSNVKCQMSNVEDGLKINLTCVKSPFSAYLATTQGKMYIFRVLNLILQQGAEFCNMISTKLVND